MTNQKNITLKEICAEHKLCPREARFLLRQAAKDEKTHPNLSKQHKPRTAWAWAKGSKALDEAINVLKPHMPKKA